MFKKAWSFTVIVSIKIILIKQETYIKKKHTLNQVMAFSVSPKKHFNHQKQKATHKFQKESKINECKKKKMFEKTFLFF